MLDLAPPSNLLTANIGTVATCHNERRKIKKEEREVAIWLLLAEGVGEYSWNQGVTRRCRLSTLTNRAPCNTSSNAGGRGIAGFQLMRIAVHTTWHGAQINFGDLNPYLTYGWSKLLCPLKNTLFSFHDFRHLVYHYSLGLGAEI